MILIFFIFPESKYFLQEYFNIQVLGSLQEKNDITTENRFSILWILFTNLIPVIILVIGCLFISKKKNIKLKPSKEILIFLMTALASSVPIAISMKQREFYLVPSIPYFAIAIALYISVIFQKINITEKNAQWIKRIAVLGIIITVIASFISFGKFSRKKDIISDIYSISEVVPAGSVISIKNSFSGDYLFHSYLTRINYMGISRVLGNEFFISSKTENYIPKNYHEIESLELNSIRLFQKNSD